MEEEDLFDNIAAPCFNDFTKPCDESTDFFTQQCSRENNLSTDDLPQILLDVATDTTTVTTSSSQKGENTVVSTNTDNSTEAEKNAAAAGTAMDFDKLEDLTRLALFGKKQPVKRRSQLRREEEEKKAVAAPVPRTREGSVPRREGSVPRREGSVPRRDGSVPRRVLSVPRRDGSVPRREGSVPRREGSVPRREGSVPRREGSIPRREGSVPRRELSVPRREGSVPRDNSVPRREPSQERVVPRRPSSLTRPTPVVRRPSVPGKTPVKPHDQPKTARVPLVVSSTGSARKPAQEVKTAPLKAPIKPSTSMPGAVTRSRSKEAAVKVGPLEKKMEGLSVSHRSRETTRRPPVVVSGNKSEKPVMNPTSQKEFVSDLRGRPCSLDKPRDPAAAKPSSSIRRSINRAPVKYAFGAPVNPTVGSVARKSTVHKEDGTENKKPFSLRDYPPPTNRTPLRRPLTITKTPNVLARRPSVTREPRSTQKSNVFDRLSTPKSKATEPVRQQAAGEQVKVPKKIPNDYTHGLRSSTRRTRSRSRTGPVPIVEPTPLE